MAHMCCTLRRLQCLSSAQPASVRVGCVVVSYSALPCDSRAWTPQEVQEITAAVVKEWAEEQGLLASQSCSLSVQVSAQVSTPVDLSSFLVFWSS